ncbi:YbdD/YjiX family protein [Chitinibacter sp. SCUT-21]|uniref:YbdD/YjiX family protein n=1 Tax=Chitinibacter sp. SCUT-21 TaxID=2970891 RepID=UPI0035A6B4EE
MLDLSFLLPSAGREQRSALADETLQDEYDRYVAEQRAINPYGVLMSPEDFRRYSLGSNWLTDSNWLADLKDTAQKVVQTCRLMVGIHDYEYYVDHMRSQHPGATPFTREEFYRYCLDARFPGAGNVNKCPC